MKNLGVFFRTEIVVHKTGPAGSMILKALYKEGLVSIWRNCHCKTFLLSKVTYMYYSPSMITPNDGVNRNRHFNV